ncbi:laminin subunit beta-1-like protein, partial [Leptotrombidium deliense]
SETAHSRSSEPKIVEGSYFDQRRNFDQRRTPYSLEGISHRPDSSRRTEYEQGSYGRNYEYSSSRDTTRDSYRGGQYSRTYNRTVVSNVDSVRQPVSSSSHITRQYNTSISQGSRVTSISSSGQRVHTPLLWYNRTWHWSTNKTRAYDADLDGTTLPPNSFDPIFENTVHKFDDNHPFNKFGQTSCDSYSCHPPVGDLLIGRENKLSASSTCGLYGPQKYCILSHLQSRKKCYTCNSDDRYKDDNYQYHKIQNIVTKEHIRNEKFWWQAENGVENVSIRLDLEAEFQFTHLIIVFQTFRPAAMIIERSDDGGNTWKIYQYFAKNCKETFRHVKMGPRRKVDDVVCEQKYSDVNPSSNGEVIFSVLPQHIQQQINNPYSEEVQSVIRITNLRINFTKLHTFGDDKLDNREEIKRKYYYAINNMVVRGSCSCYGHASRCISEGHVVPGMVYGKCDCNHNTQGANCEKCKDLYNDLRWKPANGSETNACKKCNCNNHATRCKFDEAVFQASNGVSGGVCEDCQHNTEGKNCEFCKPLFYRDPQRSIDDPNVCQPCDCDPRGVLDEGNCDNLDSDYSTVAGKCRCKDNVDGRRCDRCKPDFWNLNKSDPLGCLPCTCNKNGTVGNMGCNPTTGECICKRNVVGKNCNECAPDHFGLREEDEGCTPCDCDVGGSYSRSCDVRSGQCSCRPYLKGRTCRQIEDNFFVPDLDYLTLEGENGRSDAQSQIIIRQRYPGQEPTWTGDGFREMYPGSFIEFDVSDIPMGMDYDILVRYEPKPERVEAKVVIDSRGQSFGTCRNKINDRGTVNLEPHYRVATVSGGPFCFEKGGHYKVKLEVGPSTDISSILVDSIVLIPDVHSMDILNTPNAKREFDHFKCGQLFNSAATRPHTIPEVCKKYLHSITMQVFDGARPCDCYPLGSKSLICSKFGGRCECKPNVVGLRCDRCANGFYDLGADGCKPCDCDSVGSLDNLCDQQSGQCKCKNNTYGRKCDECQPGYWNYPSCEKCRCHGHTERCDSKTGICINCRDHTAGPHCEICEAGYYGNPLYGPDNQCKPCPCPGLPGSSMSHADSCYMDPRTGIPVCRCHPGYVGDQCDKCAENYWGNPSVPGGKCLPCDCNNNIDISQPGNCDQRTGECLKCIYHTEGPNCERCVDGYYGNATRQQCRQCICHSLGTDKSKGSCNRTSGECHCLPGVNGTQCDVCKENFWNLASGKGCEPCNCDLQGSYKQKCDELDGMCHCLKGYGGKRCDECEPNYYGDPTEKCYPCDCNTPGSATTQCARNGSCICRKGIAGERCDRCARGYYGNAPHCQFCGECFENWDMIIQNLRNHTLRLLETAKRIRNTGTTGAYKEQFLTIEEHLLEIERIISGASITENDIADIESRINELRNILNDLQDKLNNYEKQMDKTISRTTDAEINIADLRIRVKQLETDTIMLKKNMTELQAMNVDGAYNLTKQAQSRSRVAESKVQSEVPMLAQSEGLRRQTEKLLDTAAIHFNQSYNQNQIAVAEIQRKIGILEMDVPNVNELVCGGRSTLDDCDSSCGGALCPICGELSCDGAVTIAGTALEFGKKADESLKGLREFVNKQWNSIQDAKSKADEAYREALNAYNKAMHAKSESENTTKDIQDLLDKIDEFLDKALAKPSEIRTLANECIAKDISLTPTEIINLARQINETILSITNIQKILLDTAGDLATANQLRQRADLAKIRADSILNTAKQVIDILQRALEAQQKAEEAIRRATGNIDNTQKDLDLISQETAAAGKVSQGAQQGIADLQKRLDELKKLYTSNELYVEKVVKESELAGTMAKDAENGARNLETKFEDAARQLEEKANVSARVKERAENLKERARLLAENANSKLQDLQEIEDEFDENERKLKSYEKLIDDLNRDMTEHLKTIDYWANYHRSCNG